MWSHILYIRMYIPGIRNVINYNHRFGFNAGSTESIEGILIMSYHTTVIKCYFTIGKLTHATVGRVALVMALAAASGGLTSTVISGVVKVISISIFYIETTSRYSKFRHMINHVSMGKKDVQHTCKCVIYEIGQVANFSLLKTIYVL